ncbi:NTP transferase domain-containing protein [Bacillus sp. BGMRC 2118]|nr:NTP transferase domain-containing protein [Bacillus sp. BGMRC 2118]
MDDLLKVLEVINKQPSISQKKMAELCEISSGKANYMVSELIEKGLITSRKAGRTMHYTLTDSGFDLLKQGIEEFQEKKVNIHTENKKDIKLAVILAAGERRDFETPSGLLEIGGKQLLQRNLQILRDNGIEKIIVVTGYKKESLEFLESMSDIQLVENKKYKWTGSMASLASAADYITDDFLLVEDDILTEERTFKEVIEHTQRDCILLTNESGSGDEAFVELRNGYLYKISKDIHQFNRIDGEMVGISKISYEVYTNMLKEFSENRNPYLNYEYLLLDVSRQLNIGYVKIADLIWGEIDSLRHYNHVERNVYPILKRREAKYKEIQVRKQAIHAMQIQDEDILSIQPFGGMTNKNFKMILTNGEEYVLRIPGNGTEQMINRKDEKRNAALASQLGIDEELVYFNDETGVKIARFIPNAETLNAKTAKREDIMVLSTGVLRTLHTSGVTMLNTFDVFEKIEEYERILDELQVENYPDYLEVKKQVMDVKEIYQSLSIEHTPCHNDALYENMVKSGDHKLYLIDWEYGGMNDPMWDLAAHSLEAEFSIEDEELFLSLYFENSEVTDEIKKRIMINKILQDFLWSTWTIIKEAKGDDFGTYGIDRYNRCKYNLNMFLKGDF